MHTTSHIRQYLNQYLERLELSKEPQGLYEPISYTLALGGKKIRPVLCLMAAQMFNENIEPVLPAAVATELFHNFTLIHDDIMDEAPVRRGQPTVERKYGLNTAILSGDLMMILAYKELGKIDPKYLPEVLVLLSEVAIEVCEGQQYDMEFEDRESVSVDAYLEMIRQKTAVLLAGSLKMGAIVAGASPEQTNILYDYGIKIGLAFQVMDDWLDTYGSAAKVGKRIGGDIIQNKKTYLMSAAFEKANNDQKQALLDAFEIEDESKKLSTVLELLSQLKIKENVKQVIEQYYQEAKAIMAQLDIPEVRKQPLVELCDQLMHRHS